jgi:hypothetical protein
MNLRSSKLMASLRTKSAGFAHRGDKFWTRMSATQAAERDRVLNSKNVAHSGSDHAVKAGRGVLVD